MSERKDLAVIADLVPAGSRQSCSARRRSAGFSTDMSAGSRCAKVPTSRAVPQADAVALVRTWLAYESRRSFLALLPVLGVLGYETEKDAIRMANDTRYGLSAAVWARSGSLAKAM